jgi:hypothetical protein
MRQDADTSQFGTEWLEGRFRGDVAFSAMHAAFVAAAGVRPDEVCQSCYRFADRFVRLRVVGRELNANITRPFAHLRVHRDATPHALRIDLWDERTLPQGPARSPAGRAGGWHETTLKSTDERFVAQRLPHTYSCLDREASHLVGCIAWHEDIFIYERAKPLARLLLAWHNDIGFQIVHAGLIARHGDGILLAGKSGSGKSTSSLLCALDGMDFLAEDYVALESRDDGSFVGHSLYNSVFLNSDHLEGFHSIAGRAVRGTPPHEEKSVVLLSDMLPDRLERRAHIRALVFPEVSGTVEAEIQPFSKGAALLALAPSSLLQIPNRDLGGLGFERLARLVERIPCFRMGVGRDWRSITHRLDELIGRVAGPASGRREHGI